jgi:hypothetical protein
LKNAPDSFFRFHQLIRPQLALLFALNMAFVLSAFAQNANTEMLEEEANELFLEGNYREAKELYSQLTTFYPNEANYNYRFGACMLYVDKDKKFPLKFLQYAVSQPDVDPEAFFYLAKGYHYNYRFREALEYYQKFKERGSAKSQKDLEVDQQIRQCENGLKLLTNISEPIVIERKKLAVNNFYLSYKLQDIGGRVLPVPDELRSVMDKRMDYFPIMYVNKNTNIIYYSSYGKDGNTGIDLYRVNVGVDGELGQPIKLPESINTPFDDAYPFISEDGTKLFFSSKGHNSMGGYDVFSVDYDEAGNTSGVPQNMDYALNTPDNDFMYVESTKNGFAFFTSDRNNQLGEAFVYKIQPQRVPFKMAIIAGNFNAPKTKSARIIVEDIERSEFVGTYSTEAADGGYIMQLRSAQPYRFLVEVEGSDITYTGNVEIPEISELKALKQEIEIVVENGEEKMIIRNLFEEEPSIDDEELISEQLLLASDIGSSPQYDESIGEISLSDAQVLEAIEQDRSDAAGFSSELKTNAILAYELAASKEKVATQDLELSKQLMETLDQSTSQDEATATEEQINQLRESGYQAYMESKALLKLGNELTDAVSDQEELESVASQYYTKAEQSINNSQRPQTVKSYLEYQDKLKILDPSKNLYSVYERFNSETRALENKGDKLTAKSDDLRAQEDALQKEIMIFKRQYEQSNDKVEKQSITAEIGELEKEKNKVISEKNETQAQLVELFTAVQENKDLDRIIYNYLPQIESGAPQSSIKPETESLSNRLAVLGPELDPNYTVDRDENIVEEMLANDNINYEELSNSEYFLAEDASGEKIIYSESDLLTKESPYTEYYTTKLQEVIQNNQGDDFEVLRQALNINRDWRRDVDAELVYAESYLIENPLTADVKKIEKKIEKLKKTKSQKDKEIRQAEGALEEFEPSTSPYGPTRELLTYESIQNIEDNYYDQYIDAQFLETQEEQVKTTKELHEKFIRDATIQKKYLETAREKLPEGSPMVKKYDEEILALGALIMMKETGLKEQESLMAGFTEDVSTDDAGPLTAEDTTNTPDLIVEDTTFSVLSADEDTAENTGFTSDSATAEDGQSILSDTTTLAAVEEQQQNEDSPSIVPLADDTAALTTSPDEGITQNTDTQPTEDVTDGDDITEPDDTAENAMNSTDSENTGASTGASTGAGSQTSAGIPSTAAGAEILNESNAILFSGVLIPVVISSQTGKREYDESELRQEQILLDEAAYNETFNDRVVEASASELQPLEKAKERQLIDYEWLVEVEKEKAAIDLAIRETDDANYAAQLETKSVQLDRQANSLRNRMALNAMIINELSGVPVADAGVQDSDPALTGSTDEGEIDEVTGLSDNIEAGRVDTLTDTATDQDIDLTDDSVVASETGTNSSSTPVVNNVALTAEIALIENQTLEQEETETSEVDLPNDQIQETQRLQSEQSTVLDSKRAELGALRNELAITRKKKQKRALESQIRLKEAEVLYEERKADLLNERAELINQAQQNLIDNPQAEKVSLDYIVLADNLREQYELKESDISDKNIELDNTRKKKVRRQLESDIATMKQEARLLQLEADMALETSQVLDKAETATLLTSTSLGREIVIDLPETERVLTLEEQVIIQNTPEYREYQDIQSQFDRKIKEAEVIYEQAKEKEIEGTRLMKQAEVLYAQMPSLPVEERFDAQERADELRLRGDELLMDAFNEKQQAKMIRREAYFEMNQANQSILEISEVDKRNDILALITESVEEPIIDLANIDDIPDKLRGQIFARPDTALDRSFYDENKPIPMNVSLPDGLIYKVQIGAFRNPIDQATFRGFAPITGESTPNGLTRYTAGLFDQYDDANSAKTGIRGLGYSDAFVVAYYNGKRVTLNEARTYERGEVPTEGGNQLATGESYQQNLNSSVDLNIPEEEVRIVQGTGESIEVKSVSDRPAIFFTVQVGVYSQEVPPEALFNITPLNADRTPSGLIRYSSGVYSNVAKANRARNRIIASGVSDAFITAYYNGQRITVSEAIRRARPQSTGETNGTNESNVNSGTDDATPIIETETGTNNSDQNTQTGTLDTGIDTEENVQSGENINEPSIGTESDVEDSSADEELNTVSSGAVYKVLIGPYTGEIPPNHVLVILNLRDQGVESVEQEGQSFYKVGNFATEAEALSTQEELLLKGLNNTSIIQE